MGDAVQRAKDLSEAQSGAGRTTTAYDKLKTAVGGLADRTADADQRTRALRDALDLLSGGSVSVQAAQARFNEAILNANEAVDEQIAKSGDYGKTLLGLNGTLNTTSRNGQQLFTSLNNISDAASSSAVAAYDFAQKQGKDMPASLKVARDEMEKARGAALGLLKQYGIAGQEAELVADRMGLIPGQVSILLQTRGMDDALAELLAVQAEYARFPDKKQIKVEALGEEAQQKLKELGYAIELIPGTREYKVTAPTEAARAELGLLINTMAAVPKEQDVKVDAKTAVAVAGLNAVITAAKATPEARTVTVTTLSQAAIDALRNVGFTTKTLPNGKVEVTAKTGTALANISAVQGARDRLTDKSITITTKRLTIFENQAGSQADALRRQAENLSKQADGSVLTFYADGGVNGGRRENHVAQIAPAGAWRVWAEDETGGEAYVPLHPSKRPRSRAIVEETVRRLGGNPAGIQWNANGGVYADGGFSWSPGTPTGLRRTVSDVQSRYDENHTPITREEYNRKIRARANAVDRLRDAEAKLRALRRKKHTQAQEEAAERKVAAARRSLATATEAATLAEARYNKKFSLADWAKGLKSAVSANSAWEAGLRKIASRGGADVVGMLRDLGEEGAAMVNALSKASNKEFAEIVANLRKLQPKFSLTDWATELKGTVSASKTWEANLRKIASRGGADIVGMLRDLGEEGVEMVNALAKASNKQFSEIVANLRQLGPLAKATMTEFTAELKATNTTSAAFQRDLSKLAAMGYDDLAAMLAAQGDEAAQKLAAEAARDPKKAGEADKAARASGQQLTQDELATLIKIIGATTSSTTGIHAVAEKTGIDEEEIIAVAGKATTQIKSVLGKRADKLLSDLAKAQKGVAYAQGGIREGIYATSGGIVRFAEPSTHGEAYIPLARDRRRRATAVLDDVAGRFGYALTGAQDAQAGRVRVVVVRQPAALIGSMPVSVTSTSATPEEFGSEVMRRLRNAQRGGRI